MNKHGSYENEFVYKTLTWHDLKKRVNCPRCG